MIAVLHDLNLAALLAKRVIVLDCGRLAGEGPPDMIITDDMLQRTFGVAAAVHAARNNRETGLVGWGAYSHIRAIIHYISMT